MHLAEVEFNLIKLPAVIGSVSCPANTVGDAALRTQSSCITFLSDKNVIDWKADRMCEETSAGSQWGRERAYRELIKAPNRSELTSWHWATAVLHVTSTSVATSHHITSVAISHNTSVCIQVHICSHIKHTSEYRIHITSVSTSTSVFTSHHISIHITSALTSYPHL